MFNFNKLINRIQNSDKSRDTPPSPSNRQASSSSEETDGQTTEGFLCPSCMENFTSPEDLQTHYENFHSDDEVHICPVCKNRFPTSDQLQIHYTTSHTSVATVNNGDLKTLRQEVTELQTTLKEERWYSEELKREVSKLSGAVGKENSEEFALYKHQLKALEESKSLLTSEVVLLRKQLGEAVEMHTSVKQQKESLEQKAANLASEKVSLEAGIDEERSLRASAESRLAEMQDLKSNLEAQLQQRPEADDVLVLRQELVQVQTLMDRMTREREAERDKLGQENKALQAKLQELRQQLIEGEEKLSSAPTATEVAKLQETLRESTTELQTLRLAYEGQQLENEEHFQRLEEAKQLISTKECELNTVRESLEQTKGRFEKELEIARGALEQMERQLESSKLHQNEMEAALQAKDMEMKKQQQLLLGCQESSSSELMQKTQELLELKRQFEELAASFTEKESRLNDVQKQLASLQAQYQNQVTAADELKSQQWEVQAELEKEQRLRKNGEEKLQECSSEISQQRETVRRLETEMTELYAKIEAGEGSNTAIQQLQIEKTSLLEKLSEQQKLTAQQALEYNGKMEELHKKLQEMKGRLQSSTERNEKLDSSLKDLSSELSSSHKKRQNLEHDLKNKNECAAAAEASWNKQKLEMEAQLRNVQAALSSREAEIAKIDISGKKLSGELGQCKEDLKTATSKLETELQTNRQLQKSVQNLQSETADLKKQIVLKTNVVEELQRNWDGSKVALAQISEDLNKKQAEFTEQLKNSENLKESFQQQVDQLKDEKASVLNKFKSLCHVIGENCQGISRTAAGMKHDLLSIKSQHETLREKFVTKKDSLAEGIVRLVSTLAESKERLEEKTKLVENMKVKVKDLETSNGQRDEKLSHFENEIQKYSSDIRLQATCIEELQNECESKEEHLKGLAQQLSAVKQKLGEANDRVQEKESEIGELQRDREAATSRIADLDVKLADQQNQYAAVSAAYQKALIDIQESKKISDTLWQRVEESKKASAELESKLNEVRVQKTSLETELFAKQKSLSDYEEMYSNLELKSVDAQNRLIQEKDDLGKQISDLEVAQELLIQQKLEIQNSLSSVEENLQKEVASHAKTRESAMQSAAALQQKVVDTVAKMSALQSSKNAIEQEAEQVKSRLEMQMGTLQENLATLRADLCSHQDNIRVQEKKIDELSGDKLELQAQLENTSSERVAFLQRCLKSEGECEKLRAMTVDLTKKLDGALSALHELGRENQMLQIETAKHVGRKWTDDSEVTNCMGCQKLFSVTVRKHHCRQCLNIFCNQCSAKTATIPAYKKPVRVCDGCYTENFTK